MVNETADVLYFNRELNQFEVCYGSYYFVFERYNGVYVCDFSAERVARSILVATVSDNESQYTAAEVKSARGVRELMRIRGVTSSSEMLRMIKSGNILNCPFTEQDVLRANKIYGPDIAALKGKTKRSKSRKVKVDTLPWRPIRSVQVLMVDLFTVCGMWFLLSIAKPLGMLMVTHLPEGKKLGGVVRGLIAHIDAYRGRLFDIAVLRSDSEGSILAAKSRIERAGVYLELASNQQHEPVIERQIGIVKERCSTLFHSLPYKLCAVLVVWLIYFVVVRINQSLYDDTPGAVPPFCNFKLRKIDQNLDFKIGFGEYVQVHEDNGTYQNSMLSRTTGAISLCPTGNLSGSVKFLSLSTWSVITRDKWDVVPMPNDVILKLNARAEKDKTPMPKELVFQYRDRDVQCVADAAVPLPDEHYMRDPDVVLAEVGVEEGHFEDEPESDTALQPGVVAEAESDAPGVEQSELAGVVEPYDEGYVDPVESAGTMDHDLMDQSGDFDSSGMSAEDAEAFVPEPEPVAGPRRSSRVREKVDYKELHRRGYEGARRGRTTYFTVASDRVKTSKYLSKACYTGLSSRMHAYHITVREAVKKMQNGAVKSIVKEVINVWGGGKNMRPVRSRDLTMRQRRGIIRSSMFLKEKYFATGEFEKLKSRLVALGNMQDVSLYSEEERTSPTVSLLGVYVLAAVGHAEGRVFKTMDVTGAFMKSKIGEKEVLVLLDQFVAKILAKVAPEVVPFLTEKGELVVRLDSALYGCVQSAKQWYLEISSFLKSIGFVQNRMDECIFNKTTDNGKQLTTMIHVDDLLFSCVDEYAIDDVIAQLREKYTEVTVGEDMKALSYLGMVFDFTDPSKVRITMDKYVEDVLKLYEVTGYAKTPAAEDLFDVDEESPRLAEVDADVFHSRVAKLLYLAKRVRPELLPAIIFLTTRVNCSTMQDKGKLDRVLRYLNKFPRLGIGLSVSKPLSVVGYIDASFGVHSDYKSHTGAVVSLGSGPITCDSSKQKTNAKSSYEAELMGATDDSNNLFYVRNLLIEQGHKVGPAKLYQDNMSAMASIKNGKATSKRSRHINIRYFYLKDRVDIGELELEYLATDDMIADVLTKPLQGEKFRILRDKLLNFD